MNDRRHQRSNFDLICGMILGGLVVGVTLPVTSHYLEEHDAKTKMSMRARPLTGQDHKKTSKPKTKVTASADAQPASISTEALKPRKADDSKLRETPKAKKSEKTREGIRTKSVGIAAALPESLVEISDPTNADVIAAAIDAKFLNVKAGDTETKFETIFDARYSKDQLSNCRQRCLIKSTDAKGQVVHAIINGPAFADVLSDHRGTINITGVKRAVHNYEVFMVQNITFNLPKSAEAKIAPKPTEKDADALKEQPVPR